MKTFYYLLILAIITAACTSQEKKTAQTGEAQTIDTTKLDQAKKYTVDTKASLIGWTGSEGLAAITSSHNGTFSISKGSLSVTSGMLTGGDFEIDMSSLKILDIKAENKNAKLAGHLKSADFFETDKYPNATFQIASSKPLSADSIEVTGNLTMKGVTKSIAFPVRLSTSDSVVTAKAKFYINRKDWNMSYRTDKSFGDELIRPEVLIELIIAAIE
jgi:polyisoprenoid-binding protein YceI